MSKFVIMHRYLIIELRKPYNHPFIDHLVLVLFQLRWLWPLILYYTITSYCITYKACTKFQITACFVIFWVKRSDITQFGRSNKLSPCQWPLTYYCSTTYESSWVIKTVYPTVWKYDVGILYKQLNDRTLKTGRQHVGSTSINISIRMWNSQYLLYLISKCVHVIGRNRVRWRSLIWLFPHEAILPPWTNIAPTVSQYCLYYDQYCLHVQFYFSKQQLEPLD